MSVNYFADRFKNLFDGLHSVNLDQFFMTFVIFNQRSGLFVIVLYSFYHHFRSVIAAVADFRAFKNACDHLIMLGFEINDK